VSDFQFAALAAILILGFSVVATRLADILELLRKPPR